VLLAIANYAGLNLILLAVSVVVRWSVRESIIASLSVIVMYCLACYSKTPFHKAGIIFNNFYFLTLAAIIVVTGNYRAWRHFIAMRASEHADVEMRRLAIECLRQLIDLAPQVFSDFEISTLADGTEVATSPLATEA